MSISIVITNQTASAVQLDELYSTLDASGTLTVKRSMAEVDRMPALQALVLAGTVKVAQTESTDNTDILSIPVQTRGKIAGLDTSAVAVVTSAVTFTNAFATGVVPRISLGIVQSGSTAFKAKPYARLVTNTGFTAALDVTTADTTGAHTAENPTMSPAENGVLLGPFTATLAHEPLTAAAITINWMESTVAKTATVTGTSTIGGTNAANLTAASINRTTGALSVTFLTGHPPDTNSITVTYASTVTCELDWVAKY